MVVEWSACAEGLPGTRQHRASLVLIACGRTSYPNRIILGCQAGRCSAPLVEGNEQDKHGAQRAQNPQGAQSRNE